MSPVPDPPDPFDAADEWLRAGERLYRVHSSARTVTEFNPGYGQPTRFAFFGDPPMPVLYAANSREAAVAESLLHDIPQAGGILPYSKYADTVMGLIAIRRDVRLAKFNGLGLRQLGVGASDLTDTDAADYRRTVLWARAAHKAGFDGLAWTSHKCDDTRAVVLFGDRCEDAVEQDSSFACVFQIGVDLDWLITICDPLHVDVMPPGAR